MASNSAPIMLQPQAALAGSTNDSTGQHELEGVMSAMQRTLGVFELVENILLWLDPHEILQANAVCKYWHGIVKGSSASKKRAFLVRDNEAPITLPQEGRHSLSCCGLRYVLVGPSEKTYTRRKWRHYCQSRFTALPWVEGTYNRSLLQPVPTSCNIRNEIQLGLVCDFYHNWMSLDVDLVKECLNRKVQLEGGYPNMLLFRPTPTVAHIRVTFQFPAGYENVWDHTVVRLRGVRLRDIADALRERIRKWKKTKAQYIYKVTIEVQGVTCGDEHDIIFVTRESEKTYEARLTDDAVRESGDSTAGAEVQDCDELTA